MVGARGTLIATVRGDLAMVYGAMQRHGADIEVESAPGTGTTMRLSFAIATAPAVGGATPAAASVVAPLRILIVDDDPLVLRSLRDILQADGHHVTTADGGQAGIDVFFTANSQNSPFQVVITDLGMPYVDGRKVSSAVKAIVPGTVVIMLTGWGQRLIADGEVLPHVGRVLSKPPKLRDALACSVGRSD
jgi:CheY-like chemotaxis protein